MWPWTSHLILLALNFSSFKWKTLQTDFIILNPDSKSQWILQKVIKSGEYARGIRVLFVMKEVGHQKLECKKGGQSTWHTLVFCPKDIYFLSHNLSAQFHWFSWFLSTGNCNHLLVCVYLLRVIILHPATYGVVLGSNSLSAVGRKRISLSILEKDCKTAFSSHSVFLVWDFF